MSIITLFRRSRLPVETTKLFDEKSFFGAFSTDFKSAQHEVIIESPYITIRRTKELSLLCKKLVKRGVKIIVYTRNPEHHDPTLRYQSYEGLEILRSAGVKTKICNDMRHRKIASIDRNILWEGSLNMLSQSNSKEIMRRTESPELCVQMLKFTGLIGIFSARV